MKINLKLKDDQYEYTYIDHARHIARAILINENNEVCLLKLLGDDDFGHRDYVETPGGGVNVNETPSQAVIREVKEETGCESEIIDAIGIVEDYYNLIHRKNINYYFLVKVKSYGTQKLEEQEKTIIKDFSVSYRIHFFQFSIQSLHGKSHYIEIRTFEAGYPNEANPFLHTIGSGLVIGSLMLYIIGNFFIGQFGKGNLSGTREASHLFLCLQGNAGYYLMGTSAQLPQHTAGISLINRFAQHLTFTINYGVGCNEQFILFHRIGIGLVPRDVLRNFLGRKMGRERLVYIREKPHLIVHPESRQKFASAR